MRLQDRSLAITHQNNLSTYRMVPSMASYLGTTSTPFSTYLEIFNVASAIATHIKIMDSARCVPGHDRLPHPNDASRGSGCCFSPRNLPGLNTSGSGYVSGSDRTNLHQTVHVGEISIEYHSRQATNHMFPRRTVPLGIEYPS